ncbi:LysR family transcriptional regulator [Phytohabitans suffuscus]|uniref:LysR family transcriptional regulator n=1 Tax=Phytohabitans suffuscus TaxID=624315 RepID=A0A6F8YMT7_9ACTN|nr:LysR family transcriptional regulator [Phytohabitans suffuscus]BCB87455.1 LysR family transcriptional regulator [Phytohabitans suffuscus]
MHLAQLRALVAVADRGSFTRAATDLGLTQSAVSHALAALERDLGQRLVDRDRVGAVLTAVGKAVVDDAREAVRAADRVAERAAASAGELVGELRLGGMPSTNLAILPALQRRFARQHPGARVSLLEGTDDEMVDWLERGLVDLSCVVAELGTVEGPVLARDEFVALLHPEHPLAREARVGIEELLDDAFVTSKSGCEPLVESIFASQGLAFRPTHRVTQLSTIVTMVRAGMGVAILPSLMLAGDPAGVVPVPLRPRAPRTVRIGHRPGARPSALAKAFLDFVAEDRVVR